MACTSGSTACWLASQANILNNVANSMPAVERLVTGASYLIGLLFVFKAIATLKSYGESKTAMSQNASMKEPMVYLACGAMLVYFPSAFKVLMQTSFGYENVLQYAPISSSNSAFDAIFGSGSAIGEPIAIIIQVIGVIAFVRGWVLIARASGQGQQPGGTGKGLMHVFGGILAMNIVGTIDMINNTLYGT